ncbi:MAG: hypothetical protein M3416_04350 [Acidobacteriota bacterium]|nr:hypothetical protein [Acidobacteriota bacterium]
MPDTIPASERQLARFLFAVRHVERRPATNTKRGRPSRWPREKLTEAATQLRGILERETSGRISVNSFIGQYLPILAFPIDVSQALLEGAVNLQEAAYLARLTAEQLKCSPHEARTRRVELLRQHLAVQGSQTRLRTRVKELTGKVGETEILSRDMSGVVAKVDDLLEVDPTDARHMFWEEMKRLFFAMKEAAVDQVSNVLFKIGRRRSERLNKGLAHR